MSLIKTLAIALVLLVLLVIVASCTGTTSDSTGEPSNQTEGRYVTVYQSRG